MRSLRKFLLALLVLAVALAAIAIVRTLAGGTAPSPVAPIAPRAVDVERVAELLAGAIRIETMSLAPPGPSTESLAALESHLAASFPRTFAVPLERPEPGALLLRWKGSDAALPPIVLMAHQDVVPVVAGTEAEWEQPPFAGVVDAEHVWGRGAMDDKGSLVTLCAAVEALLADGFAPRRTILLAFGQNEEVLGSGAEAIARSLAAAGVRPALVLDEGMMILRDAVPGVAVPVAFVGVAEKGYATFDLVVEAQGGHSSVPRRETAISILAAALERLTSDPLPARADSPVWEMLGRVAPHAGFGTRLAFTNRWLFGPLVERQMAADPLGDALLRTTLAPTIVEGGVKENVVPPHARAVVNLRLLPGDGAAAMQEEIRRRIGDPRVRVAPVGKPNEASPVSSSSGWGFATIERSLRELRPDLVVAPGLMVAATDARYFAPLSDQVFRFAPFELDRADTARYHGTNERLSKRNLELAVRFYARLIENAAR